jgi:hypothetical protein
MATANSTRRLADSSLSARSERAAEDPSASPNEFGALLRRLLISINHVVLASQYFSDLANLPVEHEAAGTTLDEAAKTLDGLYTELDFWHVRHEHRPKAPAQSARGTGPLPDESGDGLADRLTRARKPLEHGFDDDTYTQGLIALQQSRAVVQLLIAAKQAGSIEEVGPLENGRLGPLLSLLDSELGRLEQAMFFAHGEPS